MHDSDRRHYRATIISDLHLGSRSCRADDVLGFLRDYDTDMIYLVGDIVDFWRLKTNCYWPQKRNDVVQKLLRKVRKGARIVFIPGNHDEALRDGSLSKHSWRREAEREGQPLVRTAYAG